MRINSPTRPQYPGAELHLRTSPIEKEMTTMFKLFEDLDEKTRREAIAFIEASLEADRAARPKLHLPITSPRRDVRLTSPRPLKRCA